MPKHFVFATILSSFFFFWSKFYSAILIESTSNLGTMILIYVLVFHVMTFLGDRDSLTGLYPDFGVSKERYLY